MENSVTTGSPGRRIRLDMDAGSGQYSPHSFLSTMPDLNWRNQAVKDAIGPEWNPAADENGFGRASPGG
ncbi:hypothetical protein Sgleb_02010 [Streptomyces glebosus]|uniref:Uncharacterized protein n=1 Tax=Streptomyces glebosus TaxID=249580 RepID=A0A640SMP8_9ACTN|nr:hypothetical protein [Streptomyces glebosus]GFE12154.1 hypothetical protein Sgleb_02010 [Streptomyces glebosus]GHG84773.1 hypothetical protein GCM10010513_65250 [Streptomyces glebosus]